MSDQGRNTGVIINTVQGGGAEEDGGNHDSGEKKF